MTDKTESSVTLISKLDASNPLYLHASDSSNLSSSNAMKLALMAKNKLGFVDGTCVKSESNDVLASQWERCNSIVLTWILNSVSDELYVGQVYSKLASEVWNDLKETYDKVDGSVLPSCTCNASTKFNEFSQLIKLMQFLMGLDDVYQPFRTNLLTRDPLPSVKTAFSIISREESYRSSNSGSTVPNVGFVAKANQFSNNKKKFNKGPNPNLKCTHCNKIGHVIDKCFEIHGYPPNYRSKPSQNNNQWSKSNNSVNNSVSDKSVGTSLNSLTSDQFAKLLGLLGENKVNDPSSSNVGVGMSWIVDSGANQHMVMTSENMFNLVDVSDYNITVKHPNGTNAKVTKIGCYKLSDSVVLKDVFVVPEYCVNLIYVHKLAKDNKLRVVFDEENCYIQDLCLKKTLVTGSQTDGLYFCGNSFRSVVACFNKTESMAG
ncbi:uncharacterized protein LOC110943095 [Helianthus annuus]|uniref:uncharacterized protein LOC110943095 n=1 Tax=Helianthus annuus TaxID=4232 RepID=UPI000B8F6548|nr:uncharacterized protein LOC110943095 [Helianthus annuus]